MEYTIQQLAKLSGVTTRTLRYYDEIDLLKPFRLTDSSYRIYGEWEVQLLQQILLYRELGLKLEEIKEILCSSNFDIKSALLEHRKKLLKERTRIEKMLLNVEKTIQSMKGEYEMMDKERFEGLKDKMVQENEKQYGDEIRKKYGEDVIDASNAKLRGMNEEQFKENQILEQRIIDLLKEAMQKGDIHDVKAKEAVACHKKWLKQYWPSYSIEAHKGLADMYVADERFTSYYDQHRKGMAQFLREAIYANI
ncbi:MerR family transcriptional regulator [Rummeliibacillus suwonensis]|uniref:MerR family transcriptional regulator n=1 Tax=Rummeliibacillus suwonensis TaxID=1306154 RepID=UPI001AAF3B27|nr:MerR family transcriptional regulator [Rummeliibacillus suwonensis]MBO2536148.1 MerR family transcriptional regulator [Rummeliibacillus suwonensis]